MAIQFLRSADGFDQSASTTVLKDGQPFYNKDNKQLYVGDGSTQLKDLGPVSDEAKLTRSNSSNVRASIRNDNSVFTKTGQYIENYGFGSMAIGPYNKVYGAYSTSVGYNNFVYSTKATAFGSTNKIGKPTNNSAYIAPDGDFSAYTTEMNTFVQASNSNRLSTNKLWDNNDSTGYYHSNYPDQEAFEYNPEISEGSFAAGGLNIIYAPYSFATGYGNYIKCNPAADGTWNTKGDSVAVGYKNQVFGNRNIAFGSSNKIGGNYTNVTLIGEGLTSNLNSNKVIMGAYNEEVEGSCFEIGCGSSDTNRKNAFVVTSTGVARAFGAPVGDNDVLRWQEKVALETELDNKADKATTISGYGITNAYTKSEVDNKDSSTLTSAKSYTDTKINGLDVTAITGGNTKTIISISESNGKISATYNDIAFPVTSVDGKVGAVTIDKTATPTENSTCCFTAGGAYNLWAQINDTGSNLSTELANVNDNLLDQIGSVDTSLSTHTSDKDNPHNVTKSQVGLGNVDNTSDATKKANFTGSIASGNTGFVKGGDVYNELENKANVNVFSTSPEMLTITEGKLGFKVNAYSTLSNGLSVSISEPYNYVEKMFWKLIAPNGKLTVSQLSGTGEGSTVSLQSSSGNTFQGKITGYNGNIPQTIITLTL